MTALPPAWPDAPPLTLDPLEEAQRVGELRSLKLLDTPPENRFDRITRLAADFFKVPTAYVALLDDQRQWLKSRVGVSMEECPRCMTFCQYTIHQEKPLIISDAREHPIGHGHPLVTGEPHVRFYAGVPISGPSGKKIGTFCLVDLAARAFTEQDLAALTAFAMLVEREVNLGEIIQAQHELLQTRHKLIEAKQELEHELTDAARYVRQMLPPPFENDEIVEWAFHPSLRLGGDGLGYRRIDDDLLALYILDVTGHGFGSALLAVVLLELLRNPIVQMDFSRPAVVIDRLNRTFPMKDHGGKYFSAWYGVFSRSRHEITYANGGHPPALLLTPKDGVPELTRTDSTTSVLGVLPEVATPEITVPFPPGSELLLFTDGLYELLDPQGGRGSYDEFFATLRQKVAKNEPAWEAIRRYHHNAHEQKLIDDDVSMLRFATKR